MGTYVGLKIVVDLPPNLLDRAIALENHDRDSLGQDDLALLMLCPDVYALSGLEKVANPDEPRFTHLEGSVVQINTGFRDKYLNNLMRYLFTRGIDFAAYVSQDSYFDIGDVEYIATSNPLFAQKHWDKIGQSEYNVLDITQPGYYAMHYMPPCGWSGRLGEYVLTHSEYKYES